MTRPPETDEAQAVRALGATVRDSRKRLGLGVQALAEKAGVSFGLVSQLERGMGNPSLQSIHRLAGALDVKRRLPMLLLASRPRLELVTGTLRCRP